MQKYYDLPSPKPSSAESSEFFLWSWGGRGLIIACLLFMSILLISCSKQDPIFQDTQGHSVQLSKLQGKWMILNYWAPWCHSCTKELTELNQFYKHNPNVLLYGVDFDKQSPEELKQIAQKLDIQFPILTENPSVAWHLEDIMTVPTTFIINPQGHVVQVIQRPISEKSLLQILNTLQNEITANT
ncbi:MAG: TlpA family protein disulfide reductase [Gammaproteobacteria bacterium]